MNPILTAIYTLFSPTTRITEDGNTRITEDGYTLITEKSTSFHTDIGGRMYLYHAPQEAVFPYCVFFPVSSDNDLDFTDEHEELTIQFNIFSKNNSASEVGTLLESLKTFFDNCTLEISGWRHLKFQRDMIFPNNDFSQVPPIHGYSVDYDVLIERERS